MSIVTAPPRIVSLAEWDEDFSQREHAYELVRGIPTVAPNEIIANVDAASLLVQKLGPIVRPQWRPLPQFAVHLGADDDGRHTVRQPDVTVVRRDAPKTVHRVEPGTVALVAEVVSPSSIETDWVTKRAEYAAAGIPAYLVIDVRGDRPMVVLYDRLDPATGDYADPDLDAPDFGERVTLRIGEHTVELRAADLVD